MTMTTLQGTKAVATPTRPSRVRAVIAELAFALTALPAIVYCAWHWSREQCLADTHRDELGT